eukprot:2323946-Prymnesium_polylepis.1
MLTFAGWSNRRAGAVATVVEAPDSTVYGSVVYLKDTELALLDGFEGANRVNLATNQIDPYSRLGAYRRNEVTCFLQDGTPVRGLMYVKNNLRWSGRPSEAYLEACMAHIYGMWPERTPSIEVRDGAGCLHFTYPPYPPPPEPEQLALRQPDELGVAAQSQPLAERQRAPSDPIKDPDANRKLLLAALEGAAPDIWQRARAQPDLIPVFGYGSNNIEQLRGRLDAPELLDLPALLRGYARVFGGPNKSWDEGRQSAPPATALTRGARQQYAYVRDGTVATASLLKQPGAETRGSVVLLTRAQVELLSRYEGVPQK